MIPARTTPNREVREALLQLLAHGRAITTTELRTHLSNDEFPGITQETVYRHLDALARAGQILRLRHPGRRHIFWRHQQPTPDLVERDHQ
jgi:Fe2+ or Zn2+ uptake regulation protein